MCFFFQAEDGIRDFHVTGVQTCALPISSTTCSTIRTTSSSSTPSKRLSGSPPWRTSATPSTLAAAAHSARSCRSEASTSGPSPPREVTPSPRTNQATSRPSAAKRAAVPPAPSVSSSGCAATTSTVMCSPRAPLAVLRTGGVRGDRGYAPGMRTDPLADSELAERLAVDGVARGPGVVPAAMVAALAAAADEAVAAEVRDFPPGDDQHGRVLFAPSHGGAFLELCGFDP